MLGSPLAADPAAADPPALDPARRARIDKTAREFEASFLQVMLGEMFKDVTAGAFGGGPGETAFKSFLTEAFATSMAQRGGIGLADEVARQMLKYQGLD